MSVRYECPRCQAHVTLPTPPKYAPTCSCGRTDDGKPRKTPAVMVPVAQAVRS